MSKTCLGTATTVNCPPTAVIAVEIQSRRKAGTRSGRVSMAIRRTLTRETPPRPGA